ncbi:unnamed protein product [Arabis nemorensis]|uniref:Uncharacterized protein n=1 Tax=Arabis nemorensis TaxID=586526 RepID=A0A565BC57_9BRAS|nr:unnamed protein product [Arabis nemorensis]
MEKVTTIMDFQPSQFNFIWKLEMKLKFDLRENADEGLDMVTSDGITDKSPPFVPHFVKNEVSSYPGWRYRLGVKWDRFDTIYFVTCGYGP